MNLSFTIVVELPHSIGVDGTVRGNKFTAEVYATEDTCEIRMQSGIIRKTINPFTVWDALCSVQDPDKLENCMFLSNGYFSAIAQDTEELHISVGDDLDKLMSLPVSAIHGGTFYIYLHVRPASSLSAAIRLVTLNDPTLLEDDDIGPAHAPFAAPYVAS